MAAPARDPRRAPRRSAPASGTHLRLVDRRRRARRPGVRLAAGVFALFLALFSNGVAHAVLVSGQERLDSLTAQLEQEQARNRQLHLDAAELEAPERIDAAATEKGFVPAGKTTWLTPTDQPGSVESATEERGGSGGGTNGVDQLAGATNDGSQPAGR